MTIKKPTDKEIIKALRCCSEIITLCDACPFYNSVENCHAFGLKKNALDLINRQQTEIEALKKVVLDDYATEYDNKIKSEAVKEFAERLKINITINNTNDGYLDYSVDYHCLMEDIDDLVKEMVGEEE